MFQKKPNKLWGVLALLVLPLFFAGAGIWALGFAESNPDRVLAAIVNEDEPATVDGQLVPLGRQLTAELKDTAGANFDWQITTGDEAQTGLDSGKYLAILVIPKEFSAAATSFSGDVAQQQQAMVELVLNKNTKMFESRLATDLVNTAINNLGGQLTENYLENVFLGFSTMSEQIGEAVDGAKQLADGATELDNGLQQLADGAHQLSQGATEFSTQLPQYLDGVSATVGGIQQVASAGPQLLGAMGNLADNAKKAAADSVTVAQSLGTEAQKLGGNASEIGGIAESLGANAQELGGIAQSFCGADPTDPLCAQLSSLAESVGDAATKTGAQAQGLGKQAGDLGTLAKKAGDVALAAGTADGYAKALNDKTQGLPAYVGGVSQIATQSAPLGQNTKPLKDGVRSLSSGVSSLSDGLTEVAANTPDLAVGAQELSDGMAKAVDELPQYSADEAKKQANIVTSPIGLDAADASLLGNSTPWLFAALALWLSTLSIFFFIPARARNLGGTERSLMLMLKSAWLPAAIGAGQAVLIGAVLALFGAGGVLPMVTFDGTFWAGAGLLVLGGISFALVNQLLVALFGSFGRVLSLIAAALTLLTGLLANLPAALSGTSTLLPSTALASGSGGFEIAASIITIVLWAVAAFLGLLAITARRRSLN